MKHVEFEGSDYLPSDDGITHINTYSRGKTELGRWLSNFAHEPILTPVGNFNTLEGLYHYLKITLSCRAANVSIHPIVREDVEKLRYADGHRAKTLGRDIKVLVRRMGVRTIEEPTSEFNRLFTEAMEIKLRANPKRLAELMDCLDDGMPLLHYYVTGKKVMYKPHFNWLGERIHAALDRIR